MSLCVALLLTHRLGWLLDVPRRADDSLASWRLGNSTLGDMSNSRMGMLGRRLVEAGKEGEGTAAVSDFGKEEAMLGVLAAEKVEGKLVVLGEADEREEGMPAA